VQADNRLGDSSFALHDVVGRVMRVYNDDDYDEKKSDKFGRRLSHCVPIA